MAREFNKIAILGRREDTRVAGPLAQLVEHLTQAGLEVGDDSQLEGADLAIAIGGDGTMLYAGSRVRDHEIPLLGINRGRLGFLADVLPDEMLTSVDHILDGHYCIEPRMLLSRQNVRCLPHCVAAASLLWVRMDACKMMTRLCSMASSSVLTEGTWQRAAGADSMKSGIQTDLQRHD